MNSAPEAPVKHPHLPSGIHVGFSVDVRSARRNDARLPLSRALERRGPGIGRAVGSSRPSGSGRRARQADWGGRFPCAGPYLREGAPPSASSTCRSAYNYAAWCSTRPAGRPRARQVEPTALRGRDELASRTVVIKRSPGSLGAAAAQQDAAARRWPRPPAVYARAHARYSAASPRRLMPHRPWGRSQNRNRNNSGIKSQRPK